MQYYRNVTDYETGEVRRISIGEHLTITETARELKVKRKVLTDILKKMGICNREFDEVAGKPRIRLHPEAEEKGLGIRIMGEHGPFDVLSPLCREIIEDELKAHLASISPKRWKPAFEELARYERFRADKNMAKLDPKMRVCWLVDHFEGIPAELIARGIGVASSLVYRYLDYRKQQLAGLMHPFKGKAKERDAAYFGFEAVA